MSLRFQSSPRQTFNYLAKSIWAFPILLTLILLTLTVLKISGSSMGFYHQILYSTKDPNVVLNEPEPVRSDEWLVNTQMTIAQKSNNFQRINKNIGQGADMSLLLDVPYKEWSIIFKPHNLGFFVMPFAYAFALKWWMLAYLLILSCYFFILTLLPGRRMLASLLSVAFFFSPFIQWWYLSGTLGSLTYSLFGATVIIKLVNEKRRTQSLLWGGLLAYIITCFIMILYPPFQIPCLLAVGSFIAGYLIERLRGRESSRYILQKLSIIAGAAVVSGALVLMFIAGRYATLQAINNTTYPGKRVVSSGHYDGAHLLSSHLSHQFEHTNRADLYVIADKGIANQSETSNFILLIPFLFLPGLVLLAYGYKKGHKIDWPLLATSILFVLILVRYFVPHFNLFFKLLLLDKVPHNRLLIGLGLLGFIHTILFIRNLSQRDTFPKRFGIFSYTLFVFACELGLAFYASLRFPGFITPSHAWLLSLPIPVIVYLILTKRFTLAAIGLLAFSIFSCGSINPLYRGTSIYTQTPLSQQIRKFSVTDPNGRWVAESIYTENFPALNGAPALSGVYAHPQLEFWKQIQGSKFRDYNRYAHVNFVIDRDPNANVHTRLDLVGEDNFHVLTEPCGDFLNKNNVRWLLVNSPLAAQDTCASLVSKVQYPNATYYIYQIRR